MTISDELRCEAIRTADRGTIHCSDAAWRAVLNLVNSSDRGGDRWHWRVFMLLVAEALETE